MKVSIEEVSRELDKEVIIRCHEVYYFEAVDNKVFIYCKEKVFESKQKLYELEELCVGKKFFRASKLTIINLTKILLGRPSISGKYGLILRQCS